MTILQMFRWYSIKASCFACTFHISDYSFNQFSVKTKWFTDRLATVGSPHLFVFIFKPRSGSFRIIRTCFRKMLNPHRKLTSNYSRRFSRNFATRRGMFWNSLSPIGVFVRAPWQIWGAINPTFCWFSDPKSTLWAPPFPNAGKIGKSKTIASICGYVSTSTPNMVGVPPCHLWDRLSPWCGGWGR